MTQTKLVTTQLEQPSPEPITPNTPNTSTDGFAIVYVLGFVTVWGTALWSVTKSRKPSPKHHVHPEQNDIPCRNCRYFHHDHYLKCAVNPLIAMTKDAIDCRDYCPSQQKNRWRKQPSEIPPISS